MLVATVVWIDARTVPYLRKIRRALIKNDCAGGLGYKTHLRYRLHVHENTLPFWQQSGKQPCGKEKRPLTEVALVLAFIDNNAAKRSASNSSSSSSGAELAADFTDSNALRPDVCKQK